MCIDDIRPTIPWFEEDTTEDEFDWSAVEEDLKDNLSTVMASGLSANTSESDLGIQHVHCTAQKFASHGYIYAYIVHVEVAVAKCLNYH